MTRILSDEQELIRSTVQEFAATTGVKKVAEAMRAIATGQKAPFANGLWDEMGAKGLTGVTVPEKYGGMGKGMFEQVLVMEELSKVAPIAAACLDAHCLCMNVINFHGTEEQKQKYLPQLASGSISGAAPVTDPAGSTNLPEWGIRAVPDGDDFVLNGTKHFATNAVSAGLYAVFVASQGQPGHMDVYLIDPHADGVSIQGIETFGRTGRQNATIQFDHVRVPGSDRVPHPVNATSQSEMVSYLDLSAVALGLSEACFGLALNYTKERSRMGRPLAENQAVAHRLANMALQIEQVRSLLYDTAELNDAGKIDTKLYSMTKIASSEVFAKISYQAVVLQGGVGMDATNGAYLAYQSAPEAWLGELPSDFHRDIVAEEYGIHLDSAGL